MTAPARPTRRNRGEGAQLRDELLTAADGLLVDGGEDAVTLRAVASRVGVTTPSVYRHFADKSSLLDEVAARTYADLELEAGAALVGIDEPFAALRLRGRTYVTFALAHPVHYGLLMMRRGDAGPVALAAAGHALGHLTEGVRACVDAGIFRGDPVELALSLWAAVHGCASLLISQPQFPWPRDIDAYVDRTIRMAGLGMALSSRLHGPVTSTSRRLAAQLDTAAHRLSRETS